MNVYTDGASKGNPGFAGWGWYIPSLKKAQYGGKVSATNNQMELLAIIKVLTYIKETLVDKPSEVVVNADSAYCVNALNTWVYGWVRSGWLNAKKQKVANKEMFEEALSLIHWFRDNKINLSFAKVAGHSGDPNKDKADELANKGVEHIKSQFYRKD